MSQVDNFGGVAGDFLIASSINPYAIVPHDEDPLPVVPKYIWVGTAGDVALRGLGSNEDVILPTALLEVISSPASRTSGTPGRLHKTLSRLPDHGADGTR